MFSRWYDCHAIFYMKKDFYAGQFTKRAIPKNFVMTPRLANYFITVLNKKQQIFQAVLVRNFEKAFKKEKVQLPIKNGHLYLDFMEKFVAELEAYLSAAGLKDYLLTAEELKALNQLENREWKEFKIGNLFEKIITKKLPYKAKELPKEPIGNHTLPCLTSSFVNQGLNYYAPRQNATVLREVISIPSNSDVYRAYFQSREFTVLSDAYAIRWVDEDMKLSNSQYLFIVACINEVTDLPIYSYKNKLGGWNVVKNKNIILPVLNDKIDFSFIEVFISALKKIAIKNVVQYADQKNAATKSVIDRG